MTGENGVNEKELQELEAIKEKVRQMEEDLKKEEIRREAEKKRQLEDPVDVEMEKEIEEDSRSIFCGNVDNGATDVEIKELFKDCGSIKKVTILCDKVTGHPKGFVDVEFADKASVEPAMALDESSFKGRQLKVMKKTRLRPGRDGAPTLARRTRSSFYGYGGYGPRFNAGKFKSRKNAD